MKIIHFADLHLGVETYGRIDPATGLSSRLGDFLSVFDELVDYALENKVDLVLFCGDAYKSREPTQTQQREFARRISRLATAGIPVFLLTGNHDLPNAIGRATATEIFDTLAVKNVYVASKPDTVKIPTPGGTIQVVAMPWLRRSSLLSREDSKNLSLEQVTQKMQEVITQSISNRAAALEPSLPAVLAAHVSVGSAKAGSETMMSIGQEPMLLLSTVALPAFDYIALGHIHKQQVLSESPPVIYAGSLERIDFGEENDAKGFYVIDILPGAGDDKRQVSFEFRHVKARRFLTIKVDLDGEETDPTYAVLNAINKKTEKVGESIVRLVITLPSSLESQLRNNEIKDALKEAYNFSIAREIRRETRLRLGSRSAEEITPLEGLKNYLEAQQISPERQKVLLEYGEKMIEGTET
ncbi:MAG: nuclease SbcCD subunit D [Chloroflexi bacterium RBG_13_51_18]|nr:MAG: nuclease SbcCD subunit D [Chloroflexi bacterium RBG_13_51_18]